MAHPPPSLSSTTTPSTPSYLQKRLYRLESTWLQPSTRSLGLTSSVSSGPRRPSLGCFPLRPCAQCLHHLLRLQLQLLPPSSKNGCTVWSRLSSTHSLSLLCFASSAPSVLVDLFQEPLGLFPIVHAVNSSLLPGSYSLFEHSRHASWLGSDRLNLLNHRPRSLCFPV